MPWRRGRQDFRAATLSRCLLDSLMFGTNSSTKGLWWVSTTVTSQRPMARRFAETWSSDVESKYITVKSPMIGTFYRSPSPDKDPYLNIGDTIKPGKVICIVEAMKLFNEIEAEISGTIVKVLADDSSPVEYDQPLFLVDPS